MRIKQKDLGQVKYRYIRIINGVQAIVELYDVPQFCVNIKRVIDKHVISQCYPLDRDQYLAYEYEAKDWLSPDTSFLLEQIRTCLNRVNNTDDPRLRTFFMNVAKAYGIRLANVENK